MESVLRGTIAMNPRDLSVFEHKTEAVAFYPNLAFNTVSNTAYMQLSGNK